LAHPTETLSSQGFVLPSHEIRGINLISAQPASWQRRFIGNTERLAGKPPIDVTDILNKYL